MSPASVCVLMAASVVTKVIEGEYTFVSCLRYMFEEVMSYRIRCLRLDDDTQNRALYTDLLSALTQPDYAIIPS